MPPSKRQKPAHFAAYAPPDESMPAGYVRLLLRAFGDTPARRQAILAGTGLTEADLGASLEVSVAQQLRQLDNLQALLGEGWAFDKPDLWSHAAHGALGVAGLTAPDLAGTLEAVAAFSQVRAPVTDLVPRRTAKGLTLTVRVLADLTPAQQRMLAEITLQGVASLAAAVLGGPPRDLRVTFRGPEPAYADKARGAMGAQVAWGGERDAITAPAALLSTPSPFADPSLHARAREDLEAALARLAQPDDLRPRLERLLAARSAGRLSAPAAARALGVSRRTLVRRLAEAGTGFRQLLDADLRRRARKLLDAGELSHAEIAERLGYAEPTSFSRACRRWFGGKDGAPEPNGPAPG
jgi:AraC-like DNA-binding protein